MRQSEIPRSVPTCFDITRSSIHLLLQFVIFISPSRTASFWCLASLLTTTVLTGKVEVWWWHYLGFFQTLTPAPQCWSTLKILDPHTDWPSRMDVLCSLISTVFGCNWHTSCQSASASVTTSCGISVAHSHYQHHSSLPQCLCIILLLSAHGSMRCLVTGQHGTQLLPLKTSSCGQKSHYQYCHILKTFFSTSFFLIHHHSFCSENHPPRASFSPHTTYLTCAASALWYKKSLKYHLLA